MTGTRTRSHWRSVTGAAVALVSVAALLGACGGGGGAPERARNAAAGGGATGGLKLQNSGTDKTLRGVTFVTRRAWVVGDGGTILTTTNLGHTWSPQKSGIEGDLHAVAAVDSRHAWAVGARGVIVATDDGGATWRQQNSGDTGTLLGVAFTDAQHGWAVGVGNGMVATTDGGRTWQPKTYGVPRDLYGVGFRDTQHGWAVGNGGTIVATSDGGATWNPTASGTQEALKAVQFSDAMNGIIVGYQGAILTTRDGGATWTPTPSNTKKNLAGVTFEDRGRVWAVGSSRGGTVLASTDGGRSWATQASPTNEDLYGMAFLNDTGWAVGSKGTIVIFRFKGWLPQASGTNTQLHSVKFFDVARGWAVGDGGAILATDDGGATWKPQTSGTTANLYGVDFLDLAVGTAVGDGGTILTTVDGGATWKRETSPTTKRLYAVKYSNHRNVWAVGDCACNADVDPPVMLTGDGIGTWNAVGTDLRQVPILRGVTVNDTSADPDRQGPTIVGWAVGGAPDGTRPVIAQTPMQPFPAWSVAGWTKVSLPANDRAFQDVDMGRTRAWAVGFGGVIASSAAGDPSRLTPWTLQTSGTNGDLSGVSFFDDRNGIVVGGGLALITDNGGEKWAPQDPRTPAGTLADVAYVDDAHAWAVGRSGVIMRYGFNP